MCHFVKRFELISILNHFGKWRFDCDFKSYLRQMISFDLILSQISDDF
jgi:hypothetical protein